MAESLIQVNPDSTGKKVHTFQRTIGANTVEDEVMVHGEQYLATYNIATGNTLWTTANAHALQIMAGATLNVYVRRIRVWQSVLVTTAIFARATLFRLTTAGTGGTAITPQPFDSTDAASGATAMTLPTVKGTEAAATFGIAGAIWMQTAPTGLAAPSLLYEWDFDKLLRGKSLRIAAGTANGIALKVTDAIAVGSVVIEAVISEANF